MVVHRRRYRARTGRKMKRTGYSGKLRVYSGKRKPRSEIRAQMRGEDVRAIAIRQLNPTTYTFVAAA